MQEQDVSTHHDRSALVSPQNHHHLLADVGLIDFYHISCCHHCHLPCGASLCHMGYAVGQEHTNHTVSCFLLPG